MASEQGRLSRRSAASREILSQERRPHRYVVVRFGGYMMMLPPGSRKRPNDRTHDDVSLLQRIETLRDVRRHGGTVGAEPMVEARTSRELQSLRGIGDVPAL